MDNNECVKPIGFYVVTEVNGCRVNVEVSNSSFTSFIGDMYTMFGDDIDTKTMKLASGYRKNWRVKEKTVCWELWISVQEENNVL